MSFYSNNIKCLFCFHSSASSKVDLVIAYHLSPAITGQDITKYFVPFLLAIVEKAKIDNGDVRIALMLNSRRARPTVSDHCVP